MTIKEGCIAVSAFMKTLGKAAITAISEASIGTLVKVGVVVGVAAVSMYLAVKKLRDKMKAMKHIKNGTRDPKDTPAAADIGSDPAYDNVRINMRNRVKGTYSYSLLRKTKYWKTLSKKERDELEQLERTVAEAVLGDDYDPDIDYVDIRSVKMCRDMEEKAKEKRAENEFLNRTRLSDENGIWRYWHGPMLIT